MKETNENRDWSQIIIHARKFGFKPSITKGPHVFERSDCFGRYVEVDLSASGDSEEAVVKNIINQLCEQVVDRDRSIMMMS